MALLRKRFLFLDVNEYWYTYKEGLSNWITLTACCHMKMPFRNSGLMKESRSWTIENDLTLSEEEILAGYSKSLRQQIRQAREGGVIIIFEKEINEFVTFFNDFAERHNLNPTSKRRLEELGEDCLISYAVYEGQKLSAHSYLVDRPNKIVRSWQSASGRSIEGADKTLVGKANKLLHHEDMKYFGSQGFEIWLRQELFAFDFYIMLKSNSGIFIGTCSPGLAILDDFTKYFSAFHCRRRVVDADFGKTYRL